MPSQPKKMNQTTRDALKEIGFNEETLDAIDNWQNDVPGELNFAEMLNEFVALPRDPKKAPFAETTKPIRGEYDSVTKVISLNPNLFEETCLDSDGNTQQYMALLTLAHELSHAFYDRENYDYSSAASQGASSVRDEGEARYFSFIVFHRIYAEEPAVINALKGAYDYGYWRDDSAEKEPVFVYDTFNGIVKPDSFQGFNDPQKDTKIAAMAEQSAEICGSGDSAFTYDEKGRWDWLRTKTGIGFDLLEIFINPAIKCIYIMMMFSVIMMGWKREILAEYHWKFWRRKGDTQLP